MVNGKKPNIRLINSAFVIEKTVFQDPSDFHLDRPIATSKWFKTFSIMLIPTNLNLVVYFLYVITIVCESFFPI